MGGRSYKCPLCNEWFLWSSNLQDHLKDKHGERPHFSIEGTAHFTEIVRKEKKRLENQCPKCGLDAGVVEVHGHTQCANCGHIIQDCCGD